MKFKIEKKEYEIPQHLTIEKYVKVFKIKDLFTEEYFAAKLVNIITDAPLDDLLDTDYQDVELIASQILSIIPQDKPKFVDRFKLDGVDYGFFPSWRDLTFAEYIDLDTLSTKKPDELLDLLHIITAIMYRPIIKENGQHDFKIEKYDVDKMKERAELFKKKLNIEYVLGAQFFFIKFATRYLDYTRLSLMTKPSIWQRITLLWKLRMVIWRHLFNKHSGGLSLSTDLVQTTLRNTK
jgi:hypothetical protein